MSPAFGFALLAAAATIVGAAAVAWRRSWTVNALEAMLALAAGFMVALVLMDVLPEALDRGGEHAGLIALGGFIAVHFTQHVLAPHFHFGEETHGVSPLIGVSALIGLLVHTFVDGVAIASGFEVDASLGALVGVAIVLHKLPEGLAIASLFLAAGSARGRAMLAAAALGVTTILGVLVTDRVPWLQAHGLPLAAGVLLYVAASNLVPELQRRRGWRLPVAFIFGCALYFGARLFTDH